MIVSEARLAANRANALKSTGPRTPEGKAVSRANALKHGLCSSVVVAEDATLLNKRVVEVHEALRPQDELQAYLVDRIAIYSVRIERCERLERRARDKASLRAELTWDDDRRLEAEAVGALLARRPAETVETLRRTPHGCEWLMGRWALLAHAADTHQDRGWTDEQTALAFDLLGTPAAFRAGQEPGAVLDFEGRVVEAAGSPAEVARRMVAELRDRREVVAPLDEAEQILAINDLDHDSDPEVRRIRRYESALHNRLRWSIGQVAREPLRRVMRSRYLPGWGDPGAEKPETADEKAARTHDPKSPHPPFCLEPDEIPPPGQEADIPAILRSRQEKRQAKAEARRHARRRKAEALHGGKSPG